jgi:hypothetical protein
MPAQQVGREVPEIGPDPGRELRAMGTGQRPQIEININASCGTRSRPVTVGPAGGRRLDHRRRHGELAHAQPAGKTGFSVRVP